ncbi:hypothetical protein GQ457_05G022760 [Hibiscus cannabinus]
MAEVVGVGAAERIGTVGASVVVIGSSGCRLSRGDCQSNTSFPLSDEKWTSSVAPTLADAVADGWAAAETLGWGGVVDGCAKKRAAAGNWK